MPQNLGRGIRPRRGNVRVLMEAGLRLHILGLFVQRSCPFKNNERYVIAHHNLTIRIEPHQI